MTDKRTKVLEEQQQEPVQNGATHYQPHQKAYYKRVSATEWYLWSCTGNGWIPSKGTSDSGDWIMLSPQPVKPAQQEPVADKHQAFIDSLPPDMEDKMFEQIHYWARQSYARHQRSTRGQTITAADSSDSHIIWAALRWAKENTATSQAQVTKLMKEKQND